MTKEALRQEIIDAMKSVQCFENDDEGRDAIKVEADNVMYSVERYLEDMKAQQGSQEANGLRHHISDR